MNRPYVMLYASYVFSFGVLSRGRVHRIQLVKSMTWLGQSS